LLESKYQSQTLRLRPELGTPYQVKFSMPHCIAAAVVDHRVTLDTFTSDKMEDRDIVQATKKVHLSFPDVPQFFGGGQIRIVPFILVAK
jgi:MmgE/PrpD C-terminal domain